MNIEIINVTPALAAKWLIYNAANRRLPVNNVLYYARLLKAGEFQTTHQGLSFSGTKARPKRLLDGQTRLTAIRHTGISAKMVVAWGCKPETYAAIDGGKPRTFADHHGWSVQQVAFMKSLASFASADSRKPTKHVADGIMAAFGDQYEQLIAACGTNRKYISKAPVRVGFAIAMQKNPDIATTLAGYYRQMVLSDLAGLPQALVTMFSRLHDAQDRPSGVRGNALTIAQVEKACDPQNAHTRQNRPSAAKQQELAQYVRDIIKQASLVS